MKKMGPRPPPRRSSASKSGARWSLPITFFLLFTAAQQSEPLIATPNLELAEPPATGWIIIVGGLKTWGSQSTPYSEALFGPDLPPFPVTVYANSLFRAGDRVYSCGGEYGNTVFMNCWVIDTRTEGAAWRSLDIPWGLAQHAVVVVQDEIWFFSVSKLRILDTRIPAREPREIRMGFSFFNSVCAVAHGLKTFVVGVGDERNEVYVNSNHRKPEQWVRFSTLLQGRHYFECHVFGGEVFVTGGSAGASGVLPSVEAISVVDGTVRRIAPLGGERSGHRMAIIEGRLAVLGGTNKTHALATIETYDEQTKSWKTHSLTLTEPRFWFGLTQFLP